MYQTVQQMLADNVRKVNFLLSLVETVKMAAKTAKIRKIYNPLRKTKYEIWKFIKTVIGKSNRLHPRTSARRGVMLGDEQILLDGEQILFLPIFHQIWSFFGIFFFESYSKHPRVSHPKKIREGKLLMTIYTIFCTYFPDFFAFYVKGSNTVR